MSVITMPMLMSSSRSSLPKTPIPTPATIVNASIPKIGSMPTRSAAAAPAKPMCESAWPANVSPARHQKISDEPAHDRDDRPGKERVLDE